jgi:hypothetical protein
MFEEDELETPVIEKVEDEVEIKICGRAATTRERAGEGDREREGERGNDRERGGDRE